MNDLRVGASVVLGGLVFGALAVGGAWWALDGGLYGCGPDERSLTRTLAADPLLAARTDRLAPVGESTDTCDDDDRVVTVAQSFRGTGSPAETSAAYRTLAREQGWTALPVDRITPPDCYTKRTAGTEALLSFRPGDGDGLLWVTISTAREGEGWC
ncbi:hypothetical protein [Kitasatospora sp. NPDC085879]|uniref:hypothetical protein n=1 Tax=Kitasatospora sp. NPDC085879 TaxID=3154769 RepID=UPI003412721C